MRENGTMMIERDEKARWEIMKRGARGGVYKGGAWSSLAPPAFSTYPQCPSASSQPQSESVTAYGSACFGIMYYPQYNMYNKQGWYQPYHHQPPPGTQHQLYSCMLEEQSSWAPHAVYSHPQQELWDDQATVVSSPAPPPPPPLPPSLQSDHPLPQPPPDQPQQPQLQQPLRVNPARSPFEWMKKTSYTSQPNPDWRFSAAKSQDASPEIDRKTRTKDKYRVVYTDHQRLELEKEFHYCRYITIRRKAELATALGLSERQVKIWFQNRRAKERKQVKKREEMDKEKMHQLPLM